jgi:uncharacterized protein (TIGR00251 family)
VTHYRWQGQDLILHCHLQPKAAKDEIVGPHGDRLKMRITAPPIEGKANAHLIKWLSKLCKVPQRHITILQGELGRQKTVLIQAPAVVPEALQVED